MDKKNTQNVPVLLMLFNRPDTTRKVFDMVRIAKPKRLFIAANGPRPDVPKDIELCKAVRSIFDNIDWECEVKTNYKDKNIGMQPHWHLSIDWFFNSVDRGIILEDDCVPSISFFGFCEDLLEKYKDDERIMHISGSNFQFGCRRGDASYYFSKYSHTWGWATWKRAWQKYDHKMLSFPVFKEEKVIDVISTSEKEKFYWMTYFEKLYKGDIDGCDVKWLYATWANNGLSIIPNVNMINNIGYGLSAGHTLFKDKTLGQKALDIDEIIHPQLIVRDKNADYYTFKNIFYRNFFQKAFYISAMRIVKLFR